MALKRTWPLLVCAVIACSTDDDLLSTGSTCATRFGDNDADGVADDRESWSCLAGVDCWEERIGIRRYEQDIGMDGLLEEAESGTFDSLDRPTRTVRFRGTEIEWIDTRTYEDNGRRMLIERDTGGDGSIDARNIQHFDEMGNLTGIEVELDGNFELAYEWIFDEDGNMVAYHAHFPGGVRQSELWTRTEAGDPLTFEERVGDRILTRAWWTYDAAGRLLRREEDSRADGTIDRRTTYAYDLAGNLSSKTEEFSPSLDGVLRLWRRTSYDPAGRVILEERDTNSDGEFDQAESTTYDEAGNELVREVRTSIFESLRSRITWTYEDDGTGVTIKEDSDGDGEVDRIDVWSFICD